MPVVTKTTHLKDLIGQDAWTLIQLLDLPTHFLRESPETWDKNDDYINSYKIVTNLVVVNDACERALDLFTEFNTTKITTNPTQK